MIDEVMIVREVILYIAMSLDGYIAGSDDDLSFLDGYDSYQLPQEAYKKLSESVDTLIMGRKTYTWLMKHVDVWPYQEKDTYIMSRDDYEDQEKIYFKKDCVSLVQSLKTQSGNHIWLVGGSEIIDLLMKEKLIDQYIITLIPKVLGSGIPLFKHQLATKLELVNVQYEKDLLMMTYHPKK